VPDRISFARAIGAGSTPASCSAAMSTTSPATLASSDRRTSPVTRLSWDRKPTFAGAAAAHLAALEADL